MDPSFGCSELATTMDTCWAFDDSRVVLGEFEIRALNHILAVAEGANPYYYIVRLMLMSIDDFLELSRIGVYFFPIVNRSFILY